AHAREAPTLLLRHGLEEVRHLARHRVEADDIRAPHAGFDGAQREQVRRYPSEPLRLLERVEEAVAIAVWGTSARERDLEMGPQGRDRRAQLVGRIRREATQVADRRLQAHEQ